MLFWATISVGVSAVTCALTVSGAGKHNGPTAQELELFLADPAGFVAPGAPTAPNRSAELSVILNPPNRITDESVAKEVTIGQKHQGPLYFAFGQAGVEASHRFRIKGASSYRVQVQDLFLPGDAFIVYVNNRLAFQTPITTATEEYTHSLAHAAGLFSIFSNMEFILSCTTPDCTIRVFSRSSPWNGGAAALIIDQIDPCYPEDVGLYVVRTPVEWRNAADVCDATGGRLAPIQDRRSARQGGRRIRQCVKKGNRNAWVASYEGKPSEGYPLSLWSIRDRHGGNGYIMKDTHSRTMAVLCVFTP